nr:MAG TPA: hypothetical protein [Bacteriophage sp.]
MKLLIVSRKNTGSLSYLNNMVIRGEVVTKL